MSPSERPRRSFCLPPGNLRLVFTVVLALGSCMNVQCHVCIGGTYIHWWGYSETRVWAAHRIRHTRTIGDKRGGNCKCPLAVHQRGEASVRNDLPTKDEPGYFGGYDCGYGQQRVSSPREFDYIPCACFDLLLQIKDVVCVDLAAHAIRPDPR